MNHAQAHYHWTFSVPILVPMAAYAYFYLRRFREVRRTSGKRGASARHLAAFAGAIAVLLIALVSPVDRLGEDYLFSAHMVQHLLIGDLAPLLMLLSLSRVIMRPLTRRLQGVERALGPLAHPASALVLWLGLIYFWHIPGMYDAALRHSEVHALQHVSFFTAGVMVWWPLVQPVPMRQRLTGMWTFGYIAAAKIGLASLGMYLTWTKTVVYTYYEHVPRIWGLNALTDQNVGGAIMMVEQSVLLVSVLAVLFGRMLAQSEQDELRRERLEERAAAGCSAGPLAVGSAAVDVVGLAIARDRAVRMPHDPEAVAALRCPDDHEAAWSSLGDGNLASDHRARRVRAVARGDLVEGGRLVVWQRGPQLRLRVAVAEVVALIVRSVARLNDVQKVRHVRLRRRVHALVLLGQEHRERDRGQDSDQDDHDQQLDQREAALVGVADAQSMPDHVQRVTTIGRIQFELPVVQAGMGGGLSQHQLAAAVTAAGGLGTIGIMTPNAVEWGIRHAREFASGPIAANILLPIARRAHWDAAAAADVVVTFWGKPVRRTDRIWVHQCGSVDEARAAHAAGADGVIAQGVEAGGHVRGTEPALALLERTLAALPAGYPVWSAGGVATAADVRERLDAGASAAVLGTRFLMTDESQAHAAYKQRLLEARETVLTELFGLAWPDAPHRVLWNEVTERWLAKDRRGPAWVRRVNRLMAPLTSRTPDRLQGPLLRRQSAAFPLLSPQSALVGSPSRLLDVTPLYAGECVARIHDIRPAGELTRELAGV